MKLVNSTLKWFQHVSCCLVFREEFKTKCHQDVPPQSLWSLPTCLPQNKNTHASNWGLAERTQPFMALWVFTVFKEAKDLDYSASNLITEACLPPNDKVIKMQLFHFKMPFIFSFFGNKHLISSSKHMKIKSCEGQSMGLYQRVNDSIISLP